MSQKEKPPAHREQRLFAVLGGDARLRAAADELAGRGLREVPCSEVHRADYLLAGLPAADFAPYQKELQAAAPGTLLFAGKVSRMARLQAAEYDVAVIDYLESEELALFNAVPTAEGALGILFAATPGTLWRASVLLTGYGRLSKVLAPRLQALGCRVTVVARDAAVRMLALTLGCEAAGFGELPQLAAEADFIINTVPAVVVDEAVLAALPKKAFVLDLASAPGGVDAAAAARLGVRYQSAPGLPGKYAPKAAGEAIGRTVVDFLRRHGALEEESPTGGEEQL